MILITIELIEKAIEKYFPNEAYLIDYPFTYIVNDSCTKYKIAIDDPNKLVAWVQFTADDLMKIQD
jgi:hypothetical protein